MQIGWPNPFQLMNGISLAIISFVGLESISHAAEETHRPVVDHPAHVDRTDPYDPDLRTRVFQFGARYDSRGIRPPAHGVQPFWHFLGTPENDDKAVAIMSANIPLFGVLAAVYVPLLGAILLLISSNSGVFGSSRIAYSMSQIPLAADDL